MVTLLQKLTHDHAMLLVEHDMDAVFAVADRLTVMVNGTRARLRHAGGDPRERRGAGSLPGRRGDGRGAMSA